MKKLLVQIITLVGWCLIISLFCSFVDLDLDLIQDHLDIIFFTLIVTTTIDMITSMFKKEVTEQ